MLTGERHESPEMCRRLRKVTQQIRDKARGERAADCSWGGIHFHSCREGRGRRSRKAVIPMALQVWVGTPGAAHPHTRGGLRWPARAPQPCAMVLVLPWKQEPIRGLAETMHSGLVREVWGPVFPGHLSCHLEGVVHRAEPIQRGQSSQVRVRLRHRPRDQELGWSLDPALPEADASWYFLVTGTNSPWDFAFLLLPVEVSTNSKVCAHVHTWVPRARVRAVWGLLCAQGTCSTVQPCPASCLYS